MTEYISILLCIIFLNVTIVHHEWATKLWNTTVAGHTLAILLLGTGLQYVTLHLLWWYGSGWVAELELVVDERVDILLWFFGHHNWTCLIKTLQTGSSQL